MMNSISYKLCVTTCFLLYLCKLSAHEAPLFKDILLIINYSHAHYHSIAFLKELYKPYFSTIVFIGPEPYDEVEVCEKLSNRSYFSYKCIGALMHKYPDYSGYLWVHDDCVINPWNFQRFNKNAVWFSKPNHKKLDSEPIVGLISFPNDHYVSNWSWWPLSSGYKAIKNVYEQLSPRHKSMLAKNCGQDAILFGYSDIVYFPARLKDDITQLCALMEQEKSFLEIAVPTMCGCLDDMHNWEIFDGVAIWKNRSDAYKVYTSKLDYLHPIKFSNEVLQKFIYDKFQEHDARV